MTWTRRAGSTRAGRAAAAVLVMLASGFVARPAAGQAGRGLREASPFDTVRWVDWTPHVERGGVWYEPLSIDGIPVSDIIAHCRTEHAGRARKRFAEDLVEVLSEMDRAPGGTVALELRRLDTGAAKTVERAKLSGDRRRDIVIAGVQATLSAAAVQRDLHRLAATLREGHSYFTLKGGAPAAALDAERASIAADARNGMELHAFAARLQRLVCTFGDGHAGVSGFRDAGERVYAPLILGDAGGRLVACAEDRSRLLDAAHPYVRAVDGVPVERWLAAAAPYVSAGSPQLVRHRAVGMMPFLGFLRWELGLSPDPHVTYELESEDGASTAERTLRVWPRPPRDGAWPDQPSRILPGGLGYLRLEAMSSIAEEKVRSIVPRLRHTPGLIIDVRGNTGGGREALLALMPMLMPPGAAPMVVNVAAYRLAPGRPADHLAVRHLYPRDDPSWSPAARAAIDAFAPGFAPAWAPDPAAFSAWHYLVIERADDVPHYAGPVVVLVDAGRFSATDVFLGAIERLPQVTLMGTASSGGSGRATSVPLDESELSVRYSTMISFRPTGAPFEGRGVEVDLERLPVATDFTRETDTVLDAAAAFLETRATGR